MRRFSILLNLVLGSLCALPLAAQAPSLANIPVEPGVYYQTGSGWEPLDRTNLLPLDHYGAKELLGFGRNAVAEFPGPHALIRSENRKPVFYVRGFNPLSGLTLVREQTRSDHRELKTGIGRHFPDGPRLRTKDVLAVDIQAVSPDLVSITPRAELTPGEYAILAPPDPRYRWIHFGYSFGVPADVH